ncbi:acetyltransferase, GNAT family [Anaerofustis stercorihominis DSM 17244]|uniref:Acetyltransferase, GNAT family n=2 Tax=Anaerofustis stercorihominis TaxID=214853 RepID=B1C891_9FIRM|nr:acetyltransferase, GNAT family [Anaerofustis stercorihominis DSM 17244]
MKQYTENNMTIDKININEKDKIKELSVFASNIVKEYFDPIIGSSQNDYMIEKFQSVKSITSQLNDGYDYYFVLDDFNERIGFIAFYPKGECMYLSKFYLGKDNRGKGYSKEMLDFIIDKARMCGLKGVTLNVNKNNPVINVYEHFGFVKIREEKNDIGSGFYMDDFVYRYEIV